MAGSYRDELDATRARKEALEAELEELREREQELVEREAKVAAAEAKLGERQGEADATAKKSRKRGDTAAARAEASMLRELEVARVDREWQQQEKRLLQAFGEVRRAPTAADVRQAALMALVFTPLMIATSILAFGRLAGEASWMAGAIAGVVIGGLGYRRWNMLRQALSTHTTARTEYEERRRKVLDGEDDEPVAKRKRARVAQQAE